jgi:hypothetical protein
MEDRDQKIESVLARVNNLIANPVKSTGDSDWPSLTQDQVHDFAELVYDIANLTFEPDYKERNVLAIRIVDKTKFHLHDFCVPVGSHDIYDLDEREAFELASQISRTASHMISTGGNLLDQIGSAMQYRASNMKKAVERQNDFDDLRKLLDEYNLTEFRTEADRLMEKYDPPLFVGKDAKMPYNRNGAFRKLPDELQALIDDYGVKLPEEAIQPAIIEINNALDKAEPLVGTTSPKDDYKNSFDFYIHEVREIILTHRYRVGQRALQSVVVRFNRMQEEHRVLKRLAEQGKKMVSF